jgi:hypothetical protein
LSVRPLVAVGLVSYGVYLYHIPIYALLTPERIDVSGTALLAVRLVAVLAFAALSYLLIEMPVRRAARLPLPPIVLFPAGMVAVAAIFVFACAYPADLDDGRFAMRTFRGYARDTPAGTIRVLVAGDETAEQLVDGVTSPVQVAGIRGAVAATGGCSLLGGERVVDGRTPPEPACRPWEDVFREGHEGFDPDATVLVVGGAELFDRRIDGRVLPAGSPDLTRMLRDRLDRARRILGSDGTKLILTTVPCSDPAPTFGDGWAAVRRDPTRVRWVNSVLRDFAARHPRDVRIADLDAVLCPAGNPHPQRAGTALRPDGVTLSGVGQGAVWLWIAPIARAEAS